MHFERKKVPNFIHCVKIMPSKTVNSVFISNDEISKIDLLEFLWKMGQISIHNRQQTQFLYNWIISGYNLTMKRYYSTFFWSQVLLKATNNPFIFSESIKNSLLSENLDFKNKITFFLIKSLSINILISYQLPDLMFFLNRIKSS